MKLRKDFVTNSSSTAFIITNKTDDSLTVADFALENAYLVEEYNAKYGFGGTVEAAVESAKVCYGDIELKPGDNEVIFGDEDGTVLGRIYDYILRDGGKSERFKWCFLEYYR